MGVMFRGQSQSEGRAKHQPTSASYLPDLVVTIPRLPTRLPDNGFAYRELRCRFRAKVCEGAGCGFEDLRAPCIDGLYNMLYPPWQPGTCNCRAGVLYTHNTHS